MLLKSRLRLKSLNICILSFKTHELGSIQGLSAELKLNGEALTKFFKANPTANANHYSNPLKWSKITLGEVVLFEKLNSASDLRL